MSGLLEVLQPGLGTTVQDRGRPGHRHHGLPLSGWLFVSAGWSLHEDRSLAVPTHYFGLFQVPALFGLPQAGEPLRAAVAELPEAQRQALALAKLEDLPLAEASARSGMSVGALKVATHRAVKALRRRLKVEE